MRTRRIFFQQLRRAYRARLETAAAVGADPVELSADAFHAKSTLKAANPCLKGIWRKVDVAIFAVGAQLEHGLQ